MNPEVLKALLEEFERRKNETPEDAKRHLIDAGIIDENGEVVEQYKDIFVKREDLNIANNSCNRTRQVYYDKLIKAIEKRIKESTPETARQILMAAGILDKDGEIAEPYRDLSVMWCGRPCIKGKSLQDGDPTPDSPIKIENMPNQE